MRPLLDFRSFCYRFVCSVPRSGSKKVVKFISFLGFMFFSLLFCFFYGRAMAELQVLRLFGNPLEFLPEILPLHKLRHLSLANIKIVADENLRSVNVQIEVSMIQHQ